MGISPRCSLVTLFGLFISTQSNSSQQNYNYEKHSEVYEGGGFMSKCCVEVGACFRNLVISRHSILSGFKPSDGQPTDFPSSTSPLTSKHHFPSEFCWFWW